MRPIPRPSFATALARRRAASAALAAPLRRAAAAGSSSSAACVVAAAAARRADEASASADDASDGSNHHHPSPSISGVWSLHDRHDVDRVMELWGLPAIARATAKRIGGIEIAVSSPAAARGPAPAADAQPPHLAVRYLSPAPAADAQRPHLAVRYLCPVPQFSVREVVPLSGEPARLRRRDLKPGGCSARGRVLSACGKRLSVETRWQGCAMTEEYALVEGEEEDTLVLRTTLRCRRDGEEEEKEARAVQVYKRKGGGGGGGGSSS